MVKAAAVYAISLAGLASLAAPASRAQSAFGTSAGDCPVGIELATPMLSAPTTALELDAGRAHLDGYGVSTLSGGVNLRFRDQQLFTDTLDYDHPLRQARIDGPVDFRNAQGEVRSGSAQLDLDQDRAQFEDTRFRFVSGGRGQADALVLAPQQLDLRGVEYTTCDPQDPAWAIHGERITINAERGQGVARNMQLRVADVPVLYLPWFRFPVGEQRQTGLLFPQLGSSDRTGFFLRWPLYLNLHPQADLTLTPEWLARRGLLLGGTARGLWTHGQGSLRARWLNNDQATDRERYEWGAELQTRLWPRIQAEVDYSDVSDIDFLRDLGQDNGDSRTNVLERRIELSWRPTTDLGLRARVVDFQILDPEVDGTVFTREPELVALYRPLNAWKGLRPRVRTEMVRFSDGG
ncbi:MAG: LPS assembly protein LptD, partial [Oceanococcaceae bacterium]